MFQTFHASLHLEMFSNNSRKRRGSRSRNPLHNKSYVFLKICAFNNGFLENIYHTTCKPCPSNINSLATTQRCI